MKSFILFFDSNLFVAIATLAVGGFAIWLYIRQKRDHKKDAANIILMEIRYAEQVIDRYKSSGIVIGSDVEPLLPTNNWNKYNYLFINNLDRDETDAVNSFYNQCMLVDKGLTQLSLALQLEQKSQAIHNTVSLIAKECASFDDFQTRRDLFTSLIDKDPYTFKPNAPLGAVTRSLNVIQIITTNTAGAKLKKIAHLK